jgi:uncharacterized protein with HEPN domain
MTQHDDRLPMEQMLAHAREAYDLIHGTTSAELREHRVLQLAVLKLIEIVGEAARRVSPGTQVRHPDVPWREAITTRNRISHGYDTVDYALVWDTVAGDFPPLIAALERALGSGPG